MEQIRGPRKSKDHLINREKILKVKDILCTQEY